MIVFLKYEHVGMRCTRYGETVEEIVFMGLPGHIREALHFNEAAGVKVEWDPKTNEYGAFDPSHPLKGRDDAPITPLK